MVGMKRENSKLSSGTQGTATVVPTGAQASRTKLPSAGRKNRLRWIDKLRPAQLTSSAAAKGKNKPETKIIQESGQDVGGIFSGPITPNIHEIMPRTTHFV